MRLPEENKARFNELAEARRRVNEELDLLVHNIESSEVNDERVRLEAQHLQVRHEGIIRDMLLLLVP